MKNIFSLIILVCSFAQGLSAKVITVIPSGLDAMDIQQYQYNAKTKKDPNNWQLVDKVLRENGLSFTTSDFSKSSKFKDTKKFIFSNIPWWIENWQETLSKLPKKKMVLVAYEPPTVIPEMYTKKMLSRFDRVLTWDDSLVDNKKFFKFCYPVLKSMTKDLPAFSEKKLLTQVIGNKTSTHPNELYTERLRVIKYFEEVGGNEFEFYGSGWEQSGFKNYRGRVEDKTKAMKQYRFCICYENMKNVRGYITEKIFDCFEAGCIPIYWGASNIKDYIPANCFIEREKFPTFEHLLGYIRNMRETEYNFYLANIRAFLQSEKAQAFSKEAYAKSMLRCLDVAK